MISTIVFDWKHTLYDPDRQELLTDAKVVLTRLKVKDKRIILFDKAHKNALGEVERFGIHWYCDKVIFTEQKTKREIISFIDPATTAFVGDRLNSEIAIADQIGAYKIWFKNGKYANEPSKIKPDMEVASLYEIKID